MRSESAPAAHPDALRLRAVSLWCEGLRSPAIARQLGISERTVRSWLNSARADFQAEQGETVQAILALAVERQLAIAAAAWQSYHHAVECEQLALDYYHAGLTRTARLKNIDDALPPPPPRPSTAPARYLSVALAAQREAARLAGCYDLAKAAAKLAALASCSPNRGRSPMPKPVASTPPTSAPGTPSCANRVSHPRVSLALPTSIRSIAPPGRRCAASDGPTRRPKRHFRQNRQPVRLRTVTGQMTRFRQNRQLIPSAWDPPHLRQREPAPNRP